METKEASDLQKGVPMNSIYERKNSYVSITAFYALSLPEFHMDPHTHSSCEIMCVTGGSCCVFVGSEEFHLSQNQFIFVDAQIPHKLEILPQQPCSILNLEFRCQEQETPVSLGELTRKSSDFRAFLKRQIPCLVSNDLRNLGYALKDLISQLQKGEADSEFLISILFCRTLLELSFCAVHSRKFTGMYYLKKACGYIDKNLCSTIRIPELAAYTGINKSYLQSLFSRILNCTITEYINGKRMEQAVFLLTNSSMSVTDIAFTTGYNSRQHFAHTFEKFYQTSPQKYRRLHSKTLVPDTGDGQYLMGETGTTLLKMTQD